MDFISFHPCNAVFCQYVLTVLSVPLWSVFNICQHLSLIKARWISRLLTEFLSIINEKWTQGLKTGKESLWALEEPCAGAQLGSGPQRWRSLWALRWWGCTDGLEPGLLYRACSVITADECVWEEEWGGEGARKGRYSGGGGRMGWLGRRGGGGGAQAGDRTRKGTCGRSSAPSGTTHPQPDS